MLVKKSVPSVDLNVFKKRGNAEGYSAINAVPVVSTFKASARNSDFTRSCGDNTYGINNVPPN
jgi:hypothetical protein